MGIGKSMGGIALKQDRRGPAHSSSRRLGRPRYLLGALLGLWVGAMVLASSAQAHFIYFCPGYSYNAKTKVHTLPSSQGCNTNPHTNPGVHQWATQQAKLILFYDGYIRYSTLLQSPIKIGGTGVGRRHVDLLVDGVIAADTLLNGCTSYGAKVRWPIGDHMLNPFRHFGLRSYYLYPNAAGWRGWGYPRSGACAGAPRVRSNSARMADEFFARAQREWRLYHPGDAMFNLGVALHMVQDATVPSHVHPELRTTDHFPRAPGVRLDSYPAWANVNKARNGVHSGGIYSIPSSNNGVKIARSAGGWVYWMASIAHPHFYWDSATSAVSRARLGCNVTNSPEACLSKAQSLLRVTQRGSAGFIRFFFGSVGYPPN